MKQKGITEFFGGFSLVVAILASVVLAGTRLGLIETLPGCGAGSGCDLITKGPFGSIPVIGWPVSFVGLGWFVALLCMWITGVASRGYLWLVRLGALGSLGFIITMIVLGSLCKWCLLVHVCNFVFLATVEAGYAGARNKGLLGVFKPVRFVVGFVVASALLGGGEYAAGIQKDKKQEQLAQENEDALVKGTSDASTLSLLKSRHRIGPEDAPIQIVMFTDYQCPDCKRIEVQVSEIVSSRDDVSVSIKHFPLCFDCNDNIGQFKLHANACWAARAAEAADIIGGVEKWEQMHTWLFSQGGSFTDKTLPNSLISLGYNPNEFLKVMMSEETLSRVMLDADDGFDLGIYFTPMVFINGVEYLWYYGNEGSLYSVISRIAEDAQNTEMVITAPPDIHEKYVEDWRRGKKHDNRGFGGGAWVGDGDIEFVVWGDYQSTQSVELDREVQALLKENPNIRYAYRHFPLDKTCNRFVGDNITNYEGSCFIAKAVESVHLLSGDDARWLMHNWVIESPQRGNQSVVLAKAAEISGQNQGVIQDVMESIEVVNRLQNDTAAKNVVWRKSLPVLMIDGRFVPRWRATELPANELFQRILGVIEDERTSR